jgi:Sulfotransferase domain
MNLVWVLSPHGARTGFPAGLNQELTRTFAAHNEAVIAAIPASRLLVYRVKDASGPLCEFLDVAGTTEPFPRTNSRTEFWDRVIGKN